MRATGLSRRTTALLLSAVLSVGLAASAKAASQGGSGSPATTVLAHQVIPKLDSYALLGRSNPGQRVQVGVAIASPRAAEEAAFARALYTPGSSDFHHFLTPAQRARRFGVDAATVAQVQAAVTAQGLTVAYRAPDGRYLLLAGTVSQVERTFSVTEEDHRGLDGSVFRANREAPTVPNGVTAVLGLSSIGMTRSQNICSVNFCTGTLKAQDLWSIYDQPSN